MGQTVRSRVGVVVAVLVCLGAGVVSGDTLTAKDVWPVPHDTVCSVSGGSDLSATVQVTANASSTLVDAVMTRYQKLFQSLAAGTTASKQNDETAAAAVIVASVRVSIVSTSEVLDASTNYSYVIHTGKETTVKAQTVYGAMAALETLAQVYADGKSRFSTCSIRDGDGSGGSLPHSFRGLRVDVSHRYFPVSLLEMLVDGMAAVKLNVLHLTFTTDVAFRTYLSTKPYNDIAEKQEGGVYTAGDLEHLIAYATERGVRVVPEFSLPDHVPQFSNVAIVHVKKSVNVPFCYDKATHAHRLYNDPDKVTVAAVGGFFTEMAKSVTDPYFHIGGHLTTTKAIDKCDLVNVASLQTDLIAILDSKLKRTVALWEQAPVLTSAKPALLNKVVVYANVSSFKPASKTRVVVTADAANSLSLNEANAVCKGKPRCFYKDFATNGSASEVIGAVASFSTVEFFNSSNKILSELGSQDYDDAFAVAVSSLIFPRVALLAGALWNLQANTTDAELNVAMSALSDRLNKRNVVDACPSSCTCTATSACSKPYDPKPFSSPEFGPGMTFGVCLLAFVVVIVFVSLVRHYKGAQHSDYGFIE